MPAYAFLNTPVHCPVCNAPVTDQIWFQWGFCRGRAEYPESSYRIGDDIRWRSDPSGRIRPWVYFREGGKDSGGNFGTPDITDLIARDSGQHWLRDTCPSCGTLLGGAAVAIQDGRIVRGWLTKRGELAEGADYWVRMLDGSFEPQPWNDHPMDIEDSG